MFEEMKNQFEPLDVDDLKSIEFIKHKDKIKLVVQLKIPYFNVKLYADNSIFADCFNDKEPFDHATHVFFVPEEALNPESELLLSLEDSPEEGERFYYSFLFGNPDFADKDTLLREYDSGIQIINTENETVSEGVEYSHFTCTDKNNAPVHAFLLKVDPEKATLYVGTPDDGYKNCNVVAKVPEMINSAVKNGQNVVAAVNADFFDIFGSGSPSGLCIKNGRIIANPDSNRPFTGIKKDGTPVVATVDEVDVSELECAASGLPMIVRDGQLCDWGFLEPFAFVRHPRTAAGITKDGTILLLVVDGRIPDYSNGASLVDLGKMMLSFGAERALNLDGGGSSVIYTKKDNEFVLHNVPADLYRPFDKLIRDEFNCLMITERM